VQLYTCTCSCLQDAHRHKFNVTFALVGKEVRAQLSGIGECVEGLVKSALKCGKEEEQKQTAGDHVPTR